MVVSGRRRYYLYRDQLYPSVTTIIGAYPKPALIGWAAKATAEYAVYNRRKIWAIAEADESAAVEILKNARFQKSDKAKNLGTDVHTLLATGAEPTDAERPYVEAVHVWMAEAKATTVGSEIPVVSTKHGYGGTVDRVVDSGFGRLLIDFKTGAGVYDEHHIQVAAYMHAEVGLPAGVVGCGILHVTEERASLHMTSDPEDAFDTFRALRKVAEFAGMLKTESWT